MWIELPLVLLASGLVLIVLIGPADFDFIRTPAHMFVDKGLYIIEKQVRAQKGI